MACLCNTAGIDCKQGRECPVRAALNADLEPWHLPHFSMQTLDPQQMELVTAGKPLGELLLSSGAVEGPFRRTRPVTRWRLAARRFVRSVLAFLAAPRPYL